MIMTRIFRVRPTNDDGKPRCAFCGRDAAGARNHPDPRCLRCRFPTLPCSACRAHTTHAKEIGKPARCLTCGREKGRP